MWLRPSEFKYEIEVKGWFDDKTFAITHKKFNYPFFLRYLHFNWLRLCPLP